MASGGSHHDDVIKKKTTPQKISKFSKCSDWLQILHEQRSRYVDPENIIQSIFLIITRAWQSMTSSKNQKNSKCSDCLKILHEQRSRYVGFKNVIKYTLIIIIRAWQSMTSSKKSKKIENVKLLLLSSNVVRTKAKVCSSQKYHPINMYLRIIPHFEVNIKISQCTSLLRHKSIYQLYVSKISLLNDRTIRFSWYQSTFLKDDLPGQQLFCGHNLPGHIPFRSLKTCNSDLVCAVNFGQSLSDILFFLFFCLWVWNNNILVTCVNICYR